MRPYLYQFWEFTQTHSSHLNHPLFVSVIDFHGLEDQVIPYNITSAKGNNIDVHKLNPQRFNNGQKESSLIVLSQVRAPMDLSSMNEMATFTTQK